MKTRAPKPTADLTALVLLPLTINVHWSDLFTCMSTLDYHPLSCAMYTCTK